MPVFAKLSNINELLYIIIYSKVQKMKKIYNCFAFTVLCITLIALEVVFFKMQCFKNKN